jgi:hypothetical protein
MRENLCMVSTLSEKAFAREELLQLIFLALIPVIEATALG